MQVLFFYLLSSTSRSSLLLLLFIIYLVVSHTTCLSGERELAYVLILSQAVHKINNKVLNPCQIVFSNFLKSGHSQVGRQVPFVNWWMSDLELTFIKQNQIPLGCRHSRNARPLLSLLKKARKPSRIYFRPSPDATTNIVLLFSR